MWGLTWDYELRSQVTANPLPLPFRAPGRALVAPEELIIVISSSEKDEMTPDVEPAFTVAPDSVQLWKLDSGYTPLLPLGASAIHSALELAHPEQVWVVEKLSAERLESVTFRV
jgi:hypothetical protein